MENLQNYKKILYFYNFAIDYRKTYSILYLVVEPQYIVLLT